MANADLTAQRLRELLDYDPDSGAFRWRERQPQARGWFRFAGKVAGHVGAEGYRVVSLQGKIWQAGRLAWLYMTGTLPVGVIDHINGNVGDNRWCNLRDVSHAENLHNQRRAKRQNKSGLLGVTTMKFGFVAEIQRNGERIYLGWFKTPEAAHAAYVDAKRRLHATCTL